MPAGRPRNGKTSPAYGMPAKPKGLSPQAAIEWDRITREIGESRLQITPAHRAAVELAATIAADLKNAWKETDGGKHNYIVTKAGLALHPAAKRIDALRRDYIKVLSTIGLRPGLPAESGDGEESLEEALGE